MDLRRILRTMRYSQMEQQPDPKTGQRLVPPSIKFAFLLLLLGFLGVLLVLSATGPSPGDGTGTLLEDPEANNTTLPEDPEGEERTAPEASASSPDGPHVGP